MGLHAFILESISLLMISLTDMFLGFPHMPDFSSRWTWLKFHEASCDHINSYWKLERMECIYSDRVKT